MQILIDADACPVTDIAVKFAEKYGLKIILFADTNHILHSDYAETRIIGAGREAVDIAIMNACRRCDLIVTQDYGVAAMVLGKGAYAIHQSGRWYTAENIEGLLAERYMSKKARMAKSKNHLKGPKKRTREDDACFAASFEHLIQKILKQEEHDA